VASTVINVPAGYIPGAVIKGQDNTIVAGTMYYFRVIGTTNNVRGEPSIIITVVPGNPGLALASEDNSQEYSYGQNGNSQTDSFMNFVYGMTTGLIVFTIIVVVVAFVKFAKTPSEETV